MTDYVSRQYLLDEYDRQHQGPPGGARKIIEEAPAEDVVPVRHGTWLPIVSYNNTYKCSECGRLLVDITDGLKMVAKNYPYCHCGAKMEK
jgi:DNA-directed RNA polymerase subunit RPC12/RpoP